ncbi:hypothetical protein L9F63_003870 [Diploptera punctata]|uniref:Dynein assembly factor with WDR repeat domains 1 n=1 Tax=Diploptera punctata TaxID=6984 RepID=A0AAD8E9G3_DIPPU|nr:hypothetical protein L9F63_003870 [Diploptera punctata]
MVCFFQKLRVPPSPLIFQVLVWNMYKVGKQKLKMLDLLSFSSRTNVNELAARIAEAEPLVTPNVVPQLVESLRKLQTKLHDAGNHLYHKYRVLKTHILPLTNVAFDKQGKRCITGSYDRTCKLWDIESGKEIHTLEGHKNIVYAVAFSNPFDDKILTGSFDKTARLWSADTGECYSILWGHTAEVVNVQFNPQSLLVGTSSLDMTARLYQITTGQEVATLRGHTGEVVSLQFSNDGNQIITGSFDHTISIWDTRTARREGILTGHEEEISNCSFNFDCSLIASSSMDKTAKVWDPRTFSALATIKGHDDEVLDIAFDNKGHKKEVSKACFSPAGNQLLTASLDKTARLWNTETGNCTQILEGHLDDVFSCAYSYNGDYIITASKDNTCRIWR